VSDEDIADFEVLKDVAITTNFGTKNSITGYGEGRQNFNV